MNFLSFKYYIAVANSESIKQAASTLMISPQSLSEHMRRLEQELGVELFTHSRPVRLSVCGERFLRYAEAMISERYQMEKELRELSDKHREIVLSISASDYPPFLPEVITAFSAQYPDCLLTIAERPEPVSASLLRSYDLNISAESLGGDMTEVLIHGSDVQRKSHDALNTNHLAVLVRRELLQRIWGNQFDHKIALLAEKPTLSVFGDIPFIRIMDQSLDAVTDELFRELNFFPEVVIKSVNSEMCRSLCMVGAGALVIPDGWALRKLGEHINGKELMLFRMKEFHPLMSTIVSYRAGKQLTPEETALIDMMKAFVSHL